MVIRKERKVMVFKQREMESMLFRHLEERMESVVLELQPGRSY